MFLLSKYIVALLLGITWFINTGAAEAAQSLDRTLVIVNNVPITARAFEKQAELIKQSQPKKNAVSKGMILKSLIMEELILQLAEKNGVDLNSKEFNQMVDYALQSGQVRSDLAQDREKLKKQIVIDNIQQSMMMSVDTRASEKEVKEQIQDLPSNIQKDFPVHFDLETLVIPYQDDISQQSEEKANSVRQIAEQALLKAKEGASFKELVAGQKPAWKIQSISRTLDKLPAEYSTILVNLNQGEVSGPFEFDDGLHLVRLKKASGSNIFQARHILLKLNSEADSEKIKQKLEMIRQNCLSSEKAFIQQAQQYSEDLDTVFKGGDLGWILPGYVSEPFAEVLKNLKPKEISLPFQTPYGWHIVQLIHKQLFTSVHPEWKRHMAKRIIEKRKMTEAMEKIQQELYHSGHIEWIDHSFQ